MHHWENIRANWVNGNLSDAKNMLYQQSKTAMLAAIGEAIETYLEALPAGTTQTGDLIDLQEMIHSITGKRR